MPPCQHNEDVCENCLEKVHKSTEEEEEEEEYLPTITEKRNLILANSALLGLVGFVSFYNVRFFLESVDFGLEIVKNILKTILE